MAQPPAFMQWPKTVAEIEALKIEVLTQTKDNLDAVAALKDDNLSFETVCVPLMAPPNYKTNPKVALAKFLQHCSTDEKLREAAEAAGVAFAASRVEGRMRADVFDVVKRYATQTDACALPADKKHYLDAIVSDLTRGGLGLSAKPDDGTEAAAGAGEGAPANSDRGRVAAMMAADSKACSAYGTNVAADKTELYFSAAELDGVPAEYIAARLGKGGEGKENLVKVTLKYPDIIPIASFCKIATTRRAVNLARSRDAYPGNLALMAEGAGYRQRIATALGYESHAAFVTEKRMTGSAMTVIDFLDDLETKLLPHGKVERERLQRLKHDFLAERGDGDIDIEGNAIALAELPDLHSWDSGFYSDLLLQREYGVDDNLIKQYFPLETVIAGTLAIYQELLSLKFEEVPKDKFEAWHLDVKLFAVHCTRPRPAGEVKLQGHFYLDLHPRPGKYGHAAIFHLVKRWTHSDGTKQAPVDCMLCNLPASEGDTPALLTHSDVVTFFHEFGHVMHSLCAEGDGNMTRLAKCPRDFVEAPSQMLENWCWQPSVLARLSKHHSTGEPLPTDLLQKLVAAKDVGVALQTLRQVTLAKLDMAIHHPPLYRRVMGLEGKSDAMPQSADDLQNLVATLSPAVSLIQVPKGSSILGSFGHLMNQYAAAYHGYLWSEVLSADMFCTRFGSDADRAANPDTTPPGVFSVEAGGAYRDCVLAPGGQGNIKDHLAKFLGREPKSDAFLKSRGLL